MSDEAGRGTQSVQMGRSTEIYAREWDHPIWWNRSVAPIAIPESKKIPGADCDSRAALQYTVWASF